MSRLRLTSDQMEDLAANVINQIAQSLDLARVDVERKFEVSWTSKHSLHILIKSPISSNKGSLYRTYGERVRVIKNIPITRRVSGKQFLWHCVHDNNPSLPVRAGVVTGMVSIRDRFLGIKFPHIVIHRNQPLLNYLRTGAQDTGKYEQAPSENDLKSEQ